jgi:YVTN family beta-propeller protein
VFRRPFLLAALVLVLPLLANAAEPAKGRQKLYVTNSAGDDVTVIDVATNKAVGRIEVGPHPHGIAAPASQDVNYVTIEGHGRDKPGELVWIDPQTDKVTRRMDIGPEPNQLAVTPDGKFAYVPVNDGHWEVIDLNKGKIIERLFAGSGSRPHNTLCSADGKHIYLAPMGSPKRVFVADTATHKLVGEIPFSNVVRPIALTADEKRLYVNVDGLVGIEVADVAARKMIQRVPAELTAEQKKVASRSHGIGIRPDGKEVWTCDVEHYLVQVFDVTGDRPKQTHTIPIGSQVYWLTFRPDGNVCYVSARGASAVAAVDTATKEVVARIAVGKEPKRLLIVTPPEKK